MTTAGQTTTIQVNANTNRLSSAGYDASGNMTSWGRNSYQYDTGNSMVKQNGRWYFLYTFSGERIATIDWQGSIATREVDWTIRGPGNQVLSTFKLIGEDQAGNWSREVDYIWMGRRLLGTEDGSGVKKHYHTDHLGSIRLVTDSAGNKVSEHEYLPYGQELTAPGDGVMKFTGHERDGETGMDYMHARFYTSFLGRFNSVDPILGGGGVLNRYSYVGGRPINFVDPTGRLPSLPWMRKKLARFKDRINVDSTYLTIPGSVLVGSLTGGVRTPPYAVDPLSNVAPRFYLDFCSIAPNAPKCQSKDGGDDDNTDGTPKEQLEEILEDNKARFGCILQAALAAEGPDVEAAGYVGGASRTISTHSSHARTTSRGPISEPHIHRWVPPEGALAYVHSHPPGWGAYPSDNDIHFADSMQSTFGANLPVFVVTPGAVTGYWSGHTSNPVSVADSGWNEGLSSEDCPVAREQSH